MVDADGTSGPRSSEGSAARADPAGRRRRLPRLGRARTRRASGTRCRELGYRVSALHVDHGLRGSRVGRGRALLPRAARRRGRRRPRRPTEEELRDIRYAFATDRLRATGHTASGPGRDRALPARLERRRRAGSGAPRGRRRPAAARPCGARRPRRTVPRRRARRSGTTRSNPDTKRGLIRREILPAPARARHRGPTRNLLRSLRAAHGLAGGSPSCSTRRSGSKRLDLGGGTRRRPRVRQRLARARARRARGRGALGTLDDPVAEPGLRVRGWRAGDRLAGRRRKIQDVFVDAKVPRSEREAWPLVVRGDEVVAVPGHRRGAGVRRCRASREGVSVTVRARARTSPRC